MKQLQLTLAFILLSATSLLAVTNHRGIIVPGFYIVKIEKDPALKANEAVFHFEFTNPEYRTTRTGALPVIQSSYNGKQHEITLDATLQHNLKVVPGTYKFQFFADYHHYEIYSDSVTIKPGYRTTVSIHFQKADTAIMVDKPVIYFYPPEDLTVSTTVTPEGHFNFTYPEYTNGWTGTAHPDGSISIGGKTYPYLFWDATINSNLPINNLNLRTLPNALPVDALVPEGFIVPKATITSFLEEKLTTIGLNTQEQTDFITYWGPRLAQHDSVFIQFAWGESCDNFAELKVEPQPDHINRLYILWSETTPSHPLKAQQLPVFDRSGFDVLEWGGSEIPFGIFMQNYVSTH